jgi:hypothetical protein
MLAYSLIRQGLAGSASCEASPEGARPTKLEALTVVAAPGEPVMGEQYLMGRVAWVTGGR